MGRGSRGYRCAADGERLRFADIDEVMGAQSDLGESVARFFPRLFKMAPAGERPED